MATATRISLEDWLKQPDTEPSSEFVCGEVIQKPVPNLPHFVVAGYLLHQLGSHVRQRKFGVVGPELLCVFGPMTDRRGYVPDIGFVSRERLPRGDARSVVPFPLPPDLAIEILSPVQHVGQFTEKVQFYLRHGVRLVWVVDPIVETLTIHGPDVDPITLEAHDTIDGGDVVPGFSISIGEMFAQLRLDHDDPNV